MTTPGLEMQSLLRAARRDAPSAAAKEQMYAKVLAQTAATAAAAPLASKLLGSVTAKVLAVVASVATVAGLALLITPAVVAPKLGPDVDDVAIDRSIGSSSANGDEAPRIAPASFLVLTTTAPASTAAKVATPVASDGDAVEREARWVAEARTALMRGEPQLAATKARAARALPSRMFEPEELRILGRALRVMGDERGADAAFSELVAKYPEEALRP